MIRDGHRSPRPELLAPAGGPDALLAAVNNGADAVYLGVEEFNARRGAENFALDSLSDACKLAHLHGAEVYLTANILALPEEIQRAVGLVDSAWAAGVDAVIVQDLGLMRVLLDLLPEVRMHASTQVGAHNRATIEELARLGVSRVTLARETSLDEIARLSESSSVEIESFVHGALCFCYSGQCLMSSVIGRRSGNRGLCAQHCRQEYALETSDGEAVETPGPYLLSPKDLCGLDVLPGLVRSGVAALKIEGRMKSPEYVALVTGVYRAALDRAIDDPDGFEATDAEHSILEEAFSRGFSSAYLAGIRDNRMMSYTRPNDRGVLVGRVAEVSDRAVKLRLQRPLEAGDTVEFWTSRGRFAQEAGEMRLEDSVAMAAPAGEIVEIEVTDRVSRGDRVFRVSNAALEESARRTFARESEHGRVPIDIRVRLVAGEPLWVEVSDGTHTGVAEGPHVERARTKAVTVEEIIEHVGRLGGTPYDPRSWDVELLPGVGIGFSALHRARREAIESLQQAVLSDWTERAPSQPVVPDLEERSAHEGTVPNVVAWCLEVAVAQACLHAGADEVVVPHWVLADSRPGEGFVVELPRVAHDREAEELLAGLAGIGSAVAGNVGFVRALSTGGTEVEGHWALNVTNAWTSRVYAEMGASFVWLSPELNQQQIAAVVRRSAIPAGIAVYGRQEVMVTEHCVLMAEADCDGRCTCCSRRGEWRVLVDSKGYRFPVTTDTSGRTHVYNSVTLDLSRALGDVLATSVDAIRLDFTTERPREAARVVERMRSLLRDAIAGRRPVSRPLIEPATSGHFYRGVL
ncbi:MAG: U32 family peptidase [Coriobacteriia bacterium]|nr:U32 family peptidase [Coriobacteriia bacterium]